MSISYFRNQLLPRSDSQQAVLGERNQLLLSSGTPRSH